MLEMGREGCSDVEIRAEFGLSNDLWYRWLKEDEEFSETYSKAKALCNAKWEAFGREMAFGKAEGNTATWIFNMKNRFGWKDKQEVDMNANVRVTDLTDDELDKRLKELESGSGAED